MKLWIGILTLWAAVTSGCSLLLNPELGGEGDGRYGARCASSDACDTGRCDLGRCTVSCSASAPCPGDYPAECNEATGSCRFLSPPPIAGTLKVGMLYVGPVGDHGWTLTHELSRQYFTSRISDVESQFTPSVSTGNAGAAIDEFVQRGDNVIIGTSYDFLVPFLEKSQRYPEVNFLLCSGFSTGPNLGSYFGRMYQVMYQAGVLAGRVVPPGAKVGLVGPVVIPETVRHANAFTQGVRKVNPTATVLVRWVGAWFDPPNETAATNELVDQGDVSLIFGHTDTTIPIEVAGTRRTSTGAQVLSIGYDNPDSCDFAPANTCLTSAYWNWGPMVTRILEDMRAGRWRPETPVWEQMKSTPTESSASLAPITTNTALVPSGVRLEVEGLVPELTANTEQARKLPFTGPIRDADGRDRVPSGVMMTDEALLRMCWFVEGVTNLDGSTAVPVGCVGDR